MGYLNKQTVTVDAILTKKGRELLARGRSAFNITKFAVADDEIDYGLYNPAHPLGTEYYGSVIDNMPVVEASADETQNLRYKLVTLDRTLGINTIPTIDIGQTSLNLTFGRAVQALQPQTNAVADLNLDGPQFGYTLVLFNSEAATVAVTTPVEGQAATTFTANTLSGTATVVVGRAFSIVAKDVDTITQTQITITGNQSGATTTIPVTVNPETT
jgi:hypothetical protein